MQNNRMGSLIAAALLCCLQGVPLCAADRETSTPDEKAGARALPSAEDRAGRRLLGQAKRLIESKQFDRGEQMLKTVVRDHPGSILRHQANLELGRHYQLQNKSKEALYHLGQVAKLLEPRAGRELTDEEMQLYVEAMYLTGLTYFASGQYASAFPPLRKVTSMNEGARFANQAYYYIGMAHYEMKNWNKAADALNLVGTFVGDGGDKAEFIEAGQRFYVKIKDGDLPVLRRLGVKTRVLVESGAGDKEEIECVPLVGFDDVYIGSIPVRIGNPIANSGELDVRGGDTVTAKYLDDNTQEGIKDAPRLAEVKVVSSGSVQMTLGDYQTPTATLFLNEPQLVVVIDADLDTSDAADRASVKIISRYKKELGDTDVVDIASFEEGEDEWVIRDELTLDLTEIGNPPIRSGRFVGSFRPVPLEQGEKANPEDAVLHVEEQDEIIVTYVDELHLNGDTPLPMIAKGTIVGEIQNHLRYEVDIVPDALLRAKKSLVEGEASLELAKIFKDMGLNNGAAKRADEGLLIVGATISEQDEIPTELRERAFQLKWELEMAKKDYDAALNTCQAFNRLFPDSLLIDSALMGIGRALLEQEMYPEALATFKRVTDLKNALSAAEAQYRIAQTYEKLDLTGGAKGAGKGATAPGEKHKLSQQTIMAYKQVFERHSDSAFAPEALKKVITYYMDNGELQRADELLERTIDDHPDAPFLDEMLLRWAYVSLKMRNFTKAKEKAQQLLYDYPSSKHTKGAKDILQRAQSALKGTAE